MLPLQQDWLLETSTLLMRQLEMTQRLGLACTYAARRLLMVFVVDAAPCRVSAGRLFTWDSYWTVDGRAAAFELPLLADWRLMTPCVAVW